MPSTIINDASRLRHLWTQLVTDITPSHLPSGLSSQTQTKSTVGQLNISMDFKLIQKCCKHCDISPLEVIKAAWTAVLHSYSGTDNVMFAGICMNPRLAKQSQTDMSVFLAHVEKDRSTVSVLDTIQEQGSLQAKSMVSVSEALDILCTLEPKPCNSAIWLNNSQDKLQLPLAEVVNECNFDYVVQIDSSLSKLDLIYHKPHVSGAQAEYIATTFTEYLQSICMDPLQPISNICHPSELDTLQIEAWNRIVPLEKKFCIDKLIEEVAQKTPDSPALLAWDGEMSYRELNEASNKLAVYLESIGVQRGELVPICFEKSIWTVITMIALWKLGTAWVPLDPKHPRQRLETIIILSEARTVITSPSNKALLEGLASQLIVLDPFQIQSAHEVKFTSRSQANDISFVMFTSGSTGKPKGVVHDHASVSSSALHHAAAMNISNNTRALQFGAYTFIISTFEIFTTLIFGGCLCIPSEYDRYTDIRPAIRAFDVNWCIFTPSFVRSLHYEDIPSLKTLLVAGEAVTQDIIDAWVPVTQLINMYGASECSVVMVEPMAINTHRSCIGRATGCISWLVDVEDHDRLVPIGAIGELVIEGPTLARGYLSDSEKTKAAYIENPRWARQSAASRRFYKTGDLARYGDDGRVYLVGRKDLQVKIRGQRVELTEIEAHMRTINNQVKTAVSIVHSGGKKILAAFISSQGGFDAELPHAFYSAPVDKTKITSLAAEMSQQLSQRLPPYMIPSVFIPLAYMPLTASGKTDRRLIVSFGDSLSLVELAAVAGNGNVSKSRLPTTETETALRQMWGDILHYPVEDIGVEDNFFHLGGDSIEAMNLTRRCRAEGFQLHVGEILENLVLSDMAKVMVSACASIASAAVPFELISKDLDAVRSTLVCLTGMSDNLIQDAYPCSPLQVGLMALSNKIPGSYIARHTLELPQSLTVNRFKEIWGLIVANNDVLRTTMVETEEYGILQVVNRAGIMWVHGSDLNDYIKSDEKLPMQMGDSLIRQCIISGSTTNTFVLTIHHSVYDGMSLEMIFNDLVEAVKSGEAPAARPQFRDFLQHTIENNNSKATADYWRAELSEGNMATFPALPSATHQPLANESLVHTLQLDRKGPSDFTTATIIRAAWSLVQARYCDTSEIVFGYTLSGRNAPIPGVEDIVGPVIATVPIKAQVDGEQPVAEWLQQIHSHSIEMAPAQNYGLQNIARLTESLLVIQPATSVPKDSIMQPFSAPKANFSTVALTIECSLAVDGSVEIHVHFDNVVISRPEVVRIVAQFEHVLQQLASLPTGKLSEIEIISPQDKGDLLQWNRSVPDTVNDCIHNLIAKNILSEPEAQAICAWDGNATYSELDYLSSKLAGQLIELGVGLDVYVPLCFEKSMWTIVAMIGTLKAGGAFVAMDASQPLSRMKMMAREVNARVMLCSEEQRNNCYEIVKDVIVVGPKLTKINTLSPPPTPVTSANPAYVIFTSGSTGTPKGSVIEHRAFCTAAISHKEGLQMGHRVLQFASYTFDASILEILSTLVHGGCVCVPSESERRGNIAEAMTRMNVSWAVLTPSFVNTIDPSTVPTLKTLALAGEAMSAAHVAAWTPYVQLVNGYGPSECCVCTTSNRSVLPGTMPNNIGTAVGSASWVVDREDHNKLAPIGTIGELLVEGNILARQYLNNQEKTNAAFIQRPSWLSFNRCNRLYKTGDLVKYAQDGSLLFIGRKDTQVKIRGQRVELGEIEYHLTLPTEVSQAVVSYPKSGLYAHKLVGILGLSSTAGEELTAVPSDEYARSGFQLWDLSQSLSKVLPAHMVPTIWIVVRKIPSSSSTKIDRKVVDQWLAKLPSEFKPTLAIKYGGPVTSTLRADETNAIAISKKINSLLRREDTTLEGHDFNLSSMGIDSVQVISLVNFIKQTYGVKVDVVRVLDGEMTVRGLAAWIETELSGSVQGKQPAFDALKEAAALVKEIVKNQQDQKTVFVTGATGFLGTQILRQLCNRPDVGRVIAHVRADSPSDAFNRVKDAAIRAQWWSDDYLTKLEVWSGNLGLPQLGLKPKQWASLSGESPNEGLVHAIIHAGAAVNWNAGTEILWAANVDSTAELIKAAINSPARPRMSYVSGGSRWRIGESDEDLAREIAHANGYAQTKYLSELLIKQFAVSHPSQFALVKPGLILGTPEEGVANTDDFVWRLASGVVDVQSFSDDYGSSWMYVTSSTRVAEEIIQQVFCSVDSMKTVTYMTEGITEHEFWEIFHSELKYPLRKVDHDTWLETMRSSIQKEANSHPLWPVSQVFDTLQGRLGGEPLQDAGMVTPSQKQHVKATIRKNIQFLVEAGFIANPSGKKMEYRADRVFQRSGNVWKNAKRMKGLKK
ncbi:hypothetical protein N7495_006589 [Penicillium taxi]|uniref:uncharacterized protein n=1 Tax=Penicillium taxi TaxID=168475 RepID=UPI00254571C8|nr:uncharacterized protein N7495_006589 [Penicillium taxi]KAJ5894898.1 hypothetical protein N7495_006589 [Penicillium taxi]